MRLGVLIPTWQRPDDLARCLAGLAAQTRAPDDVVVVVRAGDDESEGIVRSAAGGGLAARAVRIDRAGVVAAMNFGLAELDSDVVCITDDDTVPRADWLERMERAFDADAAVGGVGGRDFIHDLPGIDLAPHERVGKITWFGRLIGNHHSGIGPPRDVDVIKGANMAFRRAALDGIAIDERLRGAGAQVHWEVALCLAVKRAGWRLVYDPAIALDHYPAQRHDDDARNGRSLQALANIAHNETYVMVRGLPAWQRPLALLYLLFVGSRHAPGPLLAFEAIARGEPPRDVVARTRACTRARLQGLRTAVRA